MRDLDAIDQSRWTLSESRFPDPTDVATRTRKALTRFGADPDTVPVDEAAARVSASVVREEIVTAVDRLLGQERTAGVRALLRRVDADPYRDGVRDAVVADDRSKIAELAKQDAALEQPPGFVAFLGEIRAIAVERRRQLLQAAVSRRSGDLGLLMTLGHTDDEFQKDTANERLRWYQAAVAAAPANAAARIKLGNALYHKGQMDEAIACYQKAIELDPKPAMARANLAQAERLMAARNKLAAFKNGSYAPATSAERLGLVEWCQIKKLYHTAAGLYAAAFAAESKLADDLQAGHRYNAACFAALAAAGQGKTRPSSTTTSAARLRKQALDWLKADLASRGSRVNSGPPEARPAIVRTLRQWQKNTDLAGLREAAILAKLPADEKKAFTQLWADVTTLLKKAEENPKSPR